MLATLGSYDHLFGPRHVQTLSLAAHIAEVLWGLGQPQSARSLLERVVRDLNRTHATRVSALKTFRDLSLEQSLTSREGDPCERRPKSWNAGCSSQDPMRPKPSRGTSGPRNAADA